MCWHTVNFTRLGVNVNDNIYVLICEIKYSVYKKSNWSGVFGEGGICTSHDYIRMIYSTSTFGPNVRKVVMISKMVMVMVWLLTPLARIRAVNAIKSPRSAG